MCTPSREDLSKWNVGPSTCLLFGCMIKMLSSHHHMSLTLLRLQIKDQKLDTCDTRHPIYGQSFATLKIHSHMQFMILRAFLNLT